jgi:putative integral membrane protein (TIGR02587 family)
MVGRTDQPEPQSPHAARGGQNLIYPSVREFAVGAGRAFAGALLFCLPMLMTMEMWWLGFYMDPLRLALLLTLMLPLLVRLARFGGIRRTASVWDELADALVAVGVAFVASALVLWIFGVIAPHMPLHEILGKVALQAFAGSIGAILAQNQLGSRQAEDDLRKAESSYGGEIFLMVVGALFLSLNVAPTEEMILIAYRMEVWQEIGLALLTIVLMHAFVYTLEFGGTERPRPEEDFWSIFVRYTVVGYAVVILVSLYVLWTFGRTEGTSIQQILSTAIVLAFPGAIGAAAARLIL